jgi:GDPmannose 4,6-dehydratase
VRFPELVRIMVDADLEAAGLKPIGEGKKVLERYFGTWHR